MSVSQMIVRMTPMDHLPFHDAETLVDEADLKALQALAEPNRVRIVELLHHGEHCVCDVGGALDLSAALVSHHLRALRGAGLVHERRDGRWVHYALEIERLAALRAALARLLTPTESASAACNCSDCGPARTRSARPTVAALDGVGALP